MPLALIPSFIFYSIISGITPGPANLCSFSAAIRYGKKAALRQWRGLFTGYAVVAFASAFITYFVGAAFDKFLWLFSAVGFVYIMWLAFHMLTMKIEEGETRSECSFKDGFIVQITNVKIMIFCLSALGIYVLPYDSSLKALLLTAVILPFTGPIANLAWLFAGSLLKSTYEKHQKAWNIAMAVSLMLCAVSILKAGYSSFPL
ncbi:MAG: LysE family transporter [Eubacteriales bacterium]|nr:LysE family transporter [Eubacteriales bacterium]